MPGHNPENSQPVMTTGLDYGNQDRQVIGHGKNSQLNFQDLDPQEPILSPSSDEIADYERNLRIEAQAKQEVYNFVVTRKKQLGLDIDLGAVAERLQRTEAVFLNWGTGEGRYNSVIRRASIGTSDHSLRTLAHELLHAASGQVFVYREKVDYDFQKITSEAVG